MARELLYKEYGRWLKLSQHPLAYPLDLRKKLVPSRHILKGRGLIYYVFPLNYEGLALNGGIADLPAHSLRREKYENKNSIALRRYPGNPGYYPALCKYPAPCR